MAFTPFVETDRPTMAAFNEKFLQAIEAAIAGGVKIETGSYVGTGTYGADNLNTLVFKFNPVIVFFSKGTGTLVPYQAGGVSYNGWMDGSAVWLKTTSAIYLDRQTSSTKFALDEQAHTLSWQGPSAGAQLNGSGSTYNYIAIG